MGASLLKHRKALVAMGFCLLSSGLSSAASSPSAAGPFSGAAPASVTASAPSSPREISPFSMRATAFVDVNVLPMDCQRVLQGQTVLVAGGRIAAMGPAGEIRIPGGAAIVHGRGRFLIPALADMHVHLPYNDDQLEHLPTVLELFTLQGVTTIVNLLGIPQHLALRARVDQGRLLGPIIHTSGFYVNEPFVRTPEEVERAVIEQHQAGFDFIKIHGNLGREAYGRLCQAAKRLGIPVIGHIPRNLGYRPVLDEHQDVVAHAEEFVYGYFLFHRACCDEHLEAETRALARQVAEAGIRVIPTLTVFKGIVPQAEDLAAFLSRDEMRFIPTALSGEWQPGVNRYEKQTAQDLANVKGMLLIQEFLVKLLDEAGVRLLAGTDALATAAALPGFSLHEELENLVAAGLTPYAALRTATFNPAEFLGGLEEFGTIAGGRRADLLLLSGNPLEDIRNTRRIDGVMIRGRWLSSSEIRRRLQRLERAHGRRDTRR